MSSYLPRSPHTLRSEILQHGLFEFARLHHQMGLSRAKAIYFALVFALTSVASSRCLSYDYGFDVSKLVKRQSSSQVFVVRGATNAKDNIPLRKEIRELEQDQDTWTLYMLALSWMQYTSQDQLLSWYQITGEF